MRTEEFFKERKKHETMDCVVPTTLAVVEAIKDGQDVANDVAAAAKVIGDEQTSTADKVVTAVESAVHVGSDIIAAGQEMAPVIAADVEVVKGCLSACLPTRRSKRIAATAPYKPAPSKAVKTKKKKAAIAKRKKKKG